MFRPSNKHLLAGLLIVALALGLAGCGTDFDYVVSPAPDPISGISVTSIHWVVAVDYTSPSAPDPMEAVDAMPASYYGAGEYTEPAAPDALAP
jgi:hypothetical protein